MQRRQILLAGLGALGSWHFAAQAGSIRRENVSQQITASRSTSKDQRTRQGRLVIIGGAEDRTGDRIILRRFIELTKCEEPQIAVLPAASAFPDYVWGRYDQVLADLGVKRRVLISVNSPEDCNDPQLAAHILQSDGVLITGGDQRRLVSLIGGTEIDRAIHQAYHKQGACIAGTSAGAAAMSKHMLVGRGMSDGMGLVQDAIIDQHFSERRRLSRLLSAVAQNPHLIGIGVDENTALILKKERGFEVVGAGAVTIVDGRRLTSPVHDVDPEQLQQLPGMHVHRLPQGATYQLASGNDSVNGHGALTLPQEFAAPPGLQEVLPVLMQL
jgi:cyanophycinase